MSSSLSGLRTQGCRCTAPFRPRCQESPEGPEGGAVPTYSTGDDPAVQDIQPTPQFSSCPQTADSPPLTLTPTPGPVSDSAPGPLPTETETSEKAVRTPQLECPVDCQTNSFKETD